MQKFVNLLPKPAKQPQPQPLPQPVLKANLQQNLQLLTEESRELIKNSVKKDEEGNPLFDERIGMGIPDGVNTLVFTIIRHFIGQPSKISSRIHDQLSNLKCPTMSDFRWYEETLYQDAQDPNADLEEYEALLEEQLLE